MMYSNVSIFEGLSLINYIEANRYICCNRHAQPCVLCSAMLEVAQKIVEKDAFQTVSPNVPTRLCTCVENFYKCPLQLWGLAKDLMRITVFF